MMDWMRYTLEDFQTALESPSPTPGGGTASAVALGQASALTIMVCNLTLGKDKWISGWDAAERANLEAKQVMSITGDLANRDSQSFDAVMKSFRLPKESESEREIRKKKIVEATLYAAEVPFETAKHAVELLRTMPELAKHGNGNAVSDIGVASLLASAACKGAIFNVDINLGSISDEEIGFNMRNLTPKILEECSILSREIMQIVRDRINS